MHDLRYIEGKNVLYDVRYAEGNADQLPSLAAQLVRLNVDVMVTAGGPAAEAARQATTNVPIVLWGAGDPIGTSLITNASHPGGNLTGITELSTELTSKRLQLFRETVPDLHRIAVLWNVGDRAMTLRFQEVENGGAWPATQRDAATNSEARRFRCGVRCHEARPARRDPCRFGCSHTIEGRISFRVCARPAITNYVRISAFCKRRRLDRLWSEHCRDGTESGRFRG
jgi:hypothetical protein